MLARHDRTGNNVIVSEQFPTTSPEVVTIRSPDGHVSVMVDSENGGRLARVTFHDQDLLIGADHPASSHPLGWGCYPMVPFCGRVRDARLFFRGVTHALEATAPPHAIHGTVHDRSWTIVARDECSLTLAIDLDDRWPFRGSVEHHVTVDNDAVSMQITLHALDDMPAMIGWHPWFIEPDDANVRPKVILRRDDHGIATDVAMPTPDGPVDDCFVGGDELLTMTVANVVVALSSDCTHWVLYDAPRHATCVEPQSGPPNQVNDAPEVLLAGESMRRWFRIAVARP